MRKIKLPLLKVKDARALVVKQNLQILDQDQELKSMTTARDNLQNMYRYNTALLESKRQALQELKALLKQQQSEVVKAANQVVQAEKLMTALLNQSVTQLIGRVFSRMGSNVRSAIAILVARLRF